MPGGPRADGLSALHTRQSHDLDTSLGPRYPPGPFLMVSIHFGRRALAALARARLAQFTLFHRGGGRAIARTAGRHSLSRVARHRRRRNRSRAIAGHGTHGRRRRHPGDRGHAAPAGWLRDQRRCDHSPPGWPIARGARRRTDSATNPTGRRCSYRTGPGCPIAARRSAIACGYGPLRVTGAPPRDVFSTGPPAARSGIGRVHRNPLTSRA